MSDDTPTAGPPDGQPSDGRPTNGQPTDGRPELPQEESPQQPGTTPGRAPRTPAEAAGATPLDPELFRAQGGKPILNRNREIDGQIHLEPPLDVPVVPVVRRRPRPERSQRHRRRRVARILMVVALVLLVVGVAAVVFALTAGASVAVAEDDPPELVLSTPVLSARRVPETLTAPVAVRNLNAAVAPVIAATPPDSCITIAESASPLVAHNPVAGLIPASNMKVITGAAALGVLDPASRLVTRFVTDAPLADGTAEGNLYVIGGGDPLLSTAAHLERMRTGIPPSTDLAAVADQLVSTGLQRITGSVVGDESRYDAVRTADAWPERFLTQGQVGPLSALMVNDAWSPGVGPVGDPARHAASVLTELLRERGVEVVGEPASGVAPDTAAALLEVPSLTISEIVDEMLRFSDNTTAELLAKEMALQVTGTGSTAGGVEVIRQWLQDSGAPMENVTFDDASGLSENNRLTCEVLTSVLVAQGSDGSLANGLAVPGEPGTLHDRLLQPSLQGRVRAKTGTLRPATSLGGWLLTVPERQLAFAIIVNTPGAQIGAREVALQGQLLEAMLAYPDTVDPETVAPTAPVSP